MNPMEQLTGAGVDASVRVCMFCGGRPLSREHLIPRWMTQFLPEQERERGQTRIRVFRPGSERQRELSLPTRTIAERFGDQPVRVVCRPCNHGWMNVVEIEARPGLTAMVTGKAAALSATECRALAVWGTKTVMIHEATDPDTAGYHRPEHLWLFENREPPAATE